MKKNGTKPTWNFDCMAGDDFSSATVDDNNYNSILYGTEPLTQRKTITIIFDYPLGGKFPMVFKSKNGFTRADFYECVYKGYQKIYKSDKSQVKYGVWGHHIYDLALGNATEVSPGEFILGVDS